MGSINDVKKAPVLMVTKATETLETLIALKKKIQCNAIMIPVKINLNKAFVSIDTFLFFMIKYPNIKMDANAILNQTNGMASIEIKAPKIAVKPHIKTIK